MSQAVFLAERRAVSQPLLMAASPQHTPGLMDSQHTPGLMDSQLRVPTPPQVAAALHLLAFAIALWGGLLGASEGCAAAVQG